MASVLPEWEMEWVLSNNPQLLSPDPEIVKLEVIAQQYYLPRCRGYIDILCRFPDGLLVVELKNEFVDDTYVLTHQLHKYRTDLSRNSDLVQDIRCLLVSTHGFSRQVQELARSCSVGIQILPVEDLLEQAWRTESTVNTRPSVKARLLQRRLGLESLDKTRKILARGSNRRYGQQVASVDHFIETGRHDPNGLKQLATILMEISSRSPIMAHEVFDEDNGPALEGEEERWFWLFYSVLDRRANASTFVKAKEALQRCGLFRPQEISCLVENTSYEHAVNSVFQILHDNHFPLAADSVRRELAMPSSIVDAALYLAMFAFSTDNVLRYFQETTSRTGDLADRMAAHLREYIYGVGPRIAAQIIRGFCLKAGWPLKISSPEHLEQCGFNETFAGPGRLGLSCSAQDYVRDLKSFADSYLGGNCGIISHALWFIRKRFCLRPKRCDECPVGGYCNHFRLPWRPPHGEKPGNQSRRLELLPKTERAQVSA